MTTKDSASVDALFRPFTLGRLTLPNRIVMAPMTRNFSPDGVPGEDVVAYYRRRAENGVGLIVTEGTVIDHPASTDSTRVPRFFGDAALAGFGHSRKGGAVRHGVIVIQRAQVGAGRTYGTEREPSDGTIVSRESMSHAGDRGG